MRIAMNDGKFVTIKDPKDERRNLYLIINDKENKKWATKAFIIENIKSGNIINAKLKGNNILYCENNSLRVEKLNIKNITQVYRFFCDICVKNSDDYSDFSDYNVCIESFIENYKKGQEYCLRLYKNAYIVFSGSILLCFFSVMTSLGGPIVYTLYSDDVNWNKCVKLVSKRIKNSVFYKEYHDGELLKYGFKYMNLDSTISNECGYAVHYGSYFTEYDTDRFVKYIEQKYFKYKVDISKIELKLLKGSQLYNIFRKYYFEDAYEGIWVKRSSNHHSLSGFTYFSFFDAQNCNDKDYLIAFYEDKIVGVIKMGIWNDHQAIAYIDVMYTCRNQGIASFMIKNVEKYIYDNFTMCITDESSLGKKCHIADKFKKAISKVKVKTYEEAMKDRSYV